jgi:hypothetical protein
LLDSVTAGVELDMEYPGGGLPEQVPAPLPAGTWKVRVVQAESDERAWVGLVQLLVTGPDRRGGAFNAAGAPLS